MNIKQIKQAVPALLKHNIVPLLWGSQGEGKTSVTKQLAKELGYDSMIHLCLATQEVGDLIGVLLEQPDGTAKHTRPSWFPESGKHLLFLDEINRAHPDVLQAVFTLILEGKIHQHVLPKGCAIIAAANYANNNFQTTDVSDNAFMSRFCHIDFKPTVEEFCQFAEDNGAETVADFIRAYPNMLRVENADNKFDFSRITPDPRTWADFIGKLEGESSIEECRYELYSGLVGTITASTFLTWKNKNENVLSGKKLLDGYNKYRKMITNLVKADLKDVRLDMLNQTTEDVFNIIEKNTTEGTKLTPKQMENFKQFILDVPLEMGLKIVNRITNLKRWTQRSEIISNPEFVELFVKQKKLKG
jgi:alkaline phosphatase D